MTPRALVPVACALLAACTPAVIPEESPEESPDIAGTVTRVDPAGGEGERLGTVLIEEVPGEPSGSAKASVSVRRDTGLFRRAAGEVRRIDLAGVRVGDRAEAWFTGPVAESYPVQATARAIVVSGAE